MSLFSLSILLLAATVGSAQMTGDLRLVGGDYDYEGRVEVYYSGEWGTVCSNYFNLADATVICRQLRYSGATTFTRFPSVQMQGSGRIWLDNVDCYGTETALTDCHFNGWGSSSCSHYQDVVVTCSGLSDDRRDGTIRLVDGSSSKEGRVEVYYRGEWGTVCDDNFDDRAGRVVCRQLGYSADHVKVMERAYYGEGSGRIWLDNVHCYGSEASLSDCSSAGWGNENCGHYEDVSVQCGDVRKLS
ncbi:neurotrypsin-like [Corticium candelabrum]|uniref:neurotrypsin-like n=1 Tax=Corticium candelabrum TaxID=121492 RepID=UPI002E2F9F59|nr:neurotrypsin-like [Corticium candelabrum]